MALLPPPEAPLDPLKPLAAARKRFYAQAHAARNPPPPPPPKIPQPRGRKHRKVSPDVVIGMSAAGVPQNKIAEVLGVTRDGIKHALSESPDSRERIAVLREKLKDLKMQRAHRVEGKLWDRLETEVDQGDAKSVDAIARSLLASEKIQAAASGEAHASGSVAPPPVAQDIRVLIQALIGA